MRSSGCVGKSDFVTSLDTFAARTREKRKTRCTKLSTGEKEFLQAEQRRPYISDNLSGTNQLRQSAVFGTQLAVRRRVTDYTSTPPTRLLSSFAVCAALIGLCALPARAAERLCDPSFEDCRSPLIDLIRAEQVGIDVGF